MVDCSSVWQFLVLDVELRHCSGGQPVIRPLHCLLNRIPTTLNGISAKADGWMDVSARLASTAWIINFKGCESGAVMQSVFFLCGALHTQSFPAQHYRMELSPVLSQTAEQTRHSSPSCARVTHNSPTKTMNSEIHLHQDGDISSFSAAEVEQSLERRGVLVVQQGLDAATRSNNKTGESRGVLDDIGFGKHSSQQCLLPCLLRKHTDHTMYQPYGTWINAEALRPTWSGC
ncbi:uncharacterized protein LOC117824610 [Notolabrus celidotus]|uniref:uncharacterized protein LOC117824610 n=1 Tax=Notolabrus celidotus TaxID=1203425 RepID=UPI0014903DFE|nr:uncharacterized protein LOC117824610 [Notolabrus celidotus]